MAGTIGSGEGRKERQARMRDGRCGGRSGRAANGLDTQRTDAMKATLRSAGVVLAAAKEGLEW